MQQVASDGGGGGGDSDDGKKKKKKKKKEKKEKKAGSLKFKTHAVTGIVCCLFGLFCLFGVLLQ